MITVSDRNVTLTCHVTQDTKDRFRYEAERRNIGMSELNSNLIEVWLPILEAEEVERKKK